MFFSRYREVMLKELISNFWDILTSLNIPNVQYMGVNVVKVHARMVIEAEPEVKQMVNKIKQTTGKSMKEIVETLIRQEYQRLSLK